MEHSQARRARRYGPLAMLPALLLGGPVAAAGPDGPDPLVQDGIERLEAQPGEGARHRLGLLRALESEPDPDPDPLAGTGTLLRAGDLTGDGGDDFLENHFRDEVVAAVRGSDGQTMWTFDYAPGSFFGGAFAVDSLDGEAGNDVIAVSYEAVEHSSGAALTWTATFRALRGHDGAVLWTRSFAGGIAEVRFLFFTVASAYVDFAFLWDVAGDLNGDGAPDLLVKRYSDAAGPSDGAGGAVFEVLSGRTGETVAALPGVNATICSFGSTFLWGCPDAVVVPDLDGDGLPDVVVMSVLSYAAASFQARLDAYPGTGGPPLWSAPLSGRIPPRLLGVDVSGNGGGDVVAYESLFGGTSPMRAYDGTDGTVLWNRVADGGLAVTPVGDATGDGGTDLLLDETQQRRLTLVSGASGLPVWERQYAEALAWSGTVADVTGDGVRDVLVWHFSPRDYEVYSGADGSLLWSTEGASVIDVGGDLDGDGVPDFVVGDLSTSEDAYVAVSGDTGEPLWTDALGEPLPAAMGGNLRAVLAGDIRGTGRAHLVEWVEQAGDEWKAARSGEDGSPLWRRPAP